MAKRASDSRLNFKQDAPIGCAAAEDDEAFLDECFVDNGSLQTLLDPLSGKRIVVGRPGAGKSALLRKLAATAKNVIQIDPQDLAIQHITNSQVIRESTRAGVNMDTFYQSLWQHIFCIELLKEKYKFSNQLGFRQTFDRLGQKLGWGRNRKRAWEYLQSWGHEEFWEDAHTRAVRMTTKIEDQLRGTIGAGFSSIGLTAQVGRKSSSEISDETVYDAQQIVNAAKLRELHDVMELMSEDIFNDEDSYYIVIDDLDRNWVDNVVRYRLIRALVESIKRFKRLRNVKVIIALRRDLIDKIIEQTRDSGFQEEKYEDLYFQLRWTEDHLRQVLASRIGLMASRAYSRKNLSFKDIFPPKMGGHDTMKYILLHTQNRPREIIQFVNKILEAAAGRSEISKRTILEAEEQYSEQRLRALCDEWIDYLPALNKCVSLLAGPKPRFRINELSFEKVQNCILEAATFQGSETDGLVRAANKYMETCESSTLAQAMPFLREAFSTFHRLGLVGLKLHSQSTVRWCGDAVGYTKPVAIELDTFVEIHPMYQRAFGVRLSPDEESVADSAMIKRAS